MENSRNAIYALLGAILGLVLLKTKSHQEPAEDDNVNETLSSISRDLRDIKKRADLKEREESPAPPPRRRKVDRENIEETEATEVAEDIDDDDETETETETDENED